MNRQMTSLLAAGAVVAGTALSASAEMVVLVKSGNESSVTAPLMLNTRISFGKSAVDISNEGAQTVSIPYAEAQNISFAVPTGVAPVIADGTLRLKHNPVGNLLELTGHDGKPSNLVISSLAGVRILGLSAWTGEAVDVSSLAPGIYILNINNTTIKFIKQ